MSSYFSSCLLVHLVNYQVLSMSRLGGAGAVAQLVADIPLPSVEVIIVIHLNRARAKLCLILLLSMSMIDFVCYL